MSRRSTPEQRRGSSSRRPLRLIGERVTRETADAWIAAWEAKAADDGLERGSAHWQAGWDWIAEQRKARKLPEQPAT
jgi:hypothetical protein